MGFEKIVSPPERRAVLEQAGPTREELAESFFVFSREPFVQELSRFVAGAPSQAKIREFAEKYPDRWAQAVSILARLAGFSEHIDLTVSGQIQAVRSLSDIDLQLRLNQVEHDLRQLVEEAVRHKSAPPQSSQVIETTASVRS